LTITRLCTCISEIS